MQSEFSREWETLTMIKLMFNGNIPGRDVVELCGNTDGAVLRTKDVHMHCLALSRALNVSL